MLLPVMYISLAVPLWDPLLPVLQEITATTAFTLTRIAGIPAILQDYIVTIPAGQLSIRPTCSGLHYLLAALALGTFYAYLNYQGIRARLLVIAAAAGAAILANVLRVFIIIYLAYVSDMRHPIIYDHLMLGWYLFAGLVVVLMLIDHLIYRNTGPANEVARKQVDKTEPVFGQYSILRRSVVSFAAAGLIAIGPAVSWWVENRIPTAVLYDLELPRGVAGWDGPFLLYDSWSPLFHGATELKRGYQKDDSQVLLYVGLYSRQSQGSELINDFNRISNPPAWKPEGPFESALMTGGQPVIESEMVSVHGQRRIVRYFYRVAGRNTTSKYMAKFLQLIGILNGQTRAAVIAVAGDFGDDAVDARRDIEDFLRAMGPALARLVDGQVAAQVSGGHK
jgi:EpsI family protein